MSAHKANSSIAYALDHCWSLEFKQLQRIQNQLEEFLSQQESREVAMGIHDLALEIDQELERIVRDPLVGKLYEYDGRFFTPKYSRGFHRAFDGIHVLESLSEERRETFFRGREKGYAIRWLMEELGTHTWEAKVRRLNWEECKNLSIVPREVLDQIVRHIGERRASRPLSAEERVFFRSFEDQLASQG